jgi:hypothetical protein
VDRTRRAAGMDRSAWLAVELRAGRRSAVRSRWRSVRHTA